MSETTNKVELTPEKTYTLRSLEAGDAFLMASIISKIGFKEFKGCMNSPEVMDIVKKMMSEGESSDSAIASAGITVAFDIAGVVLANLHKCEKDVYNFLGNLSGMKPDAIKTMPMNDFFEMIIDVIKKEEFKGFMKVVSKLFK